MKLLSFAMVMVTAVAQKAQQQTPKRTQSISEQPSGITASLTETYIEAIKQQTGDPSKFFDEDSTIEFKSELPFGGVWQGKNISTFLKRIPLTVEYQGEVASTVLKTDDAKGTALVLTNGLCKFVRTGKETECKALHILRWDQASGKLISHQIVAQNADEYQEAYRTEAEKKLWDMLWDFFESDYEEVVDKNSPLWDAVSDDIRVKFNVFPNDLMGEQAFEGKEEVAAGFEELYQLEMNSPHFKENMYHDIANLEILASTDTEVFASMHSGDVIVHYTFEEGEQGKLIAEELILSSSLKPWDVYPFPIPTKVSGEQDDGVQGGKGSKDSEYGRSTTPQQRRSQQQQQQPFPQQRRSQQQQPFPQQQQQQQQPFPQQRRSQQQQPFPQQRRSQQQQPFPQQRFPQQQQQPFPQQQQQQPFPQQRRSQQQQPFQQGQQELDEEQFPISGGFEE